jgi:hypothetical protein
LPQQFDDDRLINAASAMVSSTRDCASQMRNSSVSKKGCSENAAVALDQRFFSEKPRHVVT